jgi:hypothetical protein
LSNSGRMVSGHLNPVGRPLKRPSANIAWNLWIAKRALNA